MDKTLMILTIETELLAALEAKTEWMLMLYIMAHSIILLY